MESMGNALKIDPVTGDIVLKTNEGGGIDFERVEDLEEVVQSLALRFRTRLGDDSLHPDIGFPIDDIIGLFDEELVASEFRKTALQDGRVSGISDIEVELERETRVVTVRGTILLKDNRTMTIEEAFGA